MNISSENNTVRCPHCGAESLDGDDLCCFCGGIAVEIQPDAGKRAVRFFSSMNRVRALSGQEQDELFGETTFNLSNPADPIWDE